MAQNNGFPINIIHNIKKKVIAKQKEKLVKKEEQQIKQTQNKKMDNIHIPQPSHKKGNQSV
jgi:hypothetical protein